MGVDTTSPPGATRRSTSGWQRDLAIVAPGWLLARLLTLGALGLARLVAARLDRDDPRTIEAVEGGLLSWDAGWYGDIAAVGYDRLPDEALRFFPLHPLLARALGVLLGDARAASVVIANVAALVLGVALVRLVRSETGDESLARRSAWLLALAPPGFVLVMGYAEGVSMLLAVAAFLALRRRGWWAAAAAGFLSGLCRPVGVLLVVPALVEAFRDRAATRREVMARLVAVAAPIAGGSVYLGWVGVTRGDALLPFSVQSRADLRGPFQANPLANLVDVVDGLVSGERVGVGLHVPWVILVTGLVVVALRRWPLSYGLFAAATLAVSLGAQSLGSFERYSYAAFPTVLAAAALASGPRSDRWWLLLLVGSAVGLVGLASLTFLGVYVP